MRPTATGYVLATLLVISCSPGGEAGSAASTTDEASSGAATTASTSSASASPTTGEPTSTATGTSTGEPLAEPFTITALDGQWITGTGGWDTQHKDVDVDLGPGNFTKVTLIVDLETTCFPFAEWETPPPGHNWPAKCDAFDRTMGFILDPADAPEDPPGFEALRSITPFGGPAHIEEDITDWANAHPGEHSLRSYINSWPDGAGIVSGSEGGWTLSVKLDVVPGPAPRDVLAAISLYAQDYGADGGQTEIGFTVPEGTVKTSLSYRVSGHGGADDPSSACIGPAEEFCKRNHHIFFDGAELSAFAAWRSDCSNFCTVTENEGGPGPGSYCLENPCGAIGSVNAARANWCPGDVVAPFVGPVMLTPGEHSFGFLVDDVFPGGSWTTSAVLYAYGP